MSFQSVHPHARGERRPGDRRETSYAGSSPRPWGTGCMTPCGAFSRAVHPHARGERDDFSKRLKDLGGSSPRPWGTVALQVFEVSLHRFIPTPVGNGSRLEARAIPTAVHPHARGERHDERQAAEVGVGSSPRPWGTGTRPARPDPGIRFIPTPVGNGPWRRPGTPRSTVHPHARGERPRRTEALTPASGSSPRPWGTAQRVEEADQRSRFIPTPVGNGSWMPSAASWMPVHPHARGERVTCRGSRLRIAGSSPRPWGTGNEASLLGYGRRFIPTPVGNGSSSCLIASRIAGSSPRPWGTGRRTGCAGPPRRFIPTPVGNGPFGCSPLPAPPVHPHARGERGPGAEDRGYDGGSSPRPWGTGRANLRSAFRVRFIPTPVGNGLPGTTGKKRTCRVAPSVPIF